MEPTKLEIEIVEKLADVWNLYLSLPREHSMETDEFCTAIHHCQNMIAARPTYRYLKRKWLSEQN